MGTHAPTASAKEASPFGPAPTQTTPIGGQELTKAVAAANTPELLAALLGQYPTHQQAIIQLANAQHGNAFVAKAMAATGTNDDPKLRAAMTAKYGVRPKRYDGLFDGNMPNERPFLDSIPKVVAQLNQAAAKAGKRYRFTEAEIATNFITEGGYLLLVHPVEVRGPISGFGYFGIDTFMQRLAELQPWMSRDLSTWKDDPAHREPRTNEKGEAVESLIVRDIPMGAEANGVMFAAARERFSDDAASLKISDAKLTPEAWFFWTTVYYNAGEGTGRAMLKKHGVDYWKVKYTKAPNDRDAKSNAAWRTSTWDYLRQHGGDDLDALTAPKKP